MRNKAERIEAHYASIGRLIRGTGLFLLLLFSVSCEHVVLDQRFHNPSLSDWTVIDEPDTVEGPSDWVVQEGWLHQRSNIWGKRGDFLGKWYGTLLVAGDERWNNYELSLKTKPIDNDGFGVIFRFIDPQHFYRLLFLQEGLNGGPLTRLDKRIGEDYTQIWSSPAGYQSGREMIITIAVDGTRIRASVDRSVLVEITDDSFQRGKIGLFCFAQSDQAFDDVRVTLQ